MLDAPIRRFAASPLEALADGMVRAGVRANTITCLGFAMGMVAAALIATADFLPAVVFLALNRFADVLDGMIARRTRATALGAFLDTSLDMFVAATVPFGFALAHQQDGLAAAFLMLGLIVAAVPGLAARALTPHANVNAPPAPPFALIGHSETFIAFALMCVAPRWTFSIFAYLFGVLCFMSGGIGVGSAIANFRTQAKP